MSAYEARLAAERIAASRRGLARDLPRPASVETAAEGGCGVLGLACEVPVAGRHLIPSLAQMRNRGNGKGGGVAMVGLDPAQLGTTREVLEEDYLLGVAYLDGSVREEVERRFLHPSFEIDHVHDFAGAGADNLGIFGLDVEPPRVAAYFVRPKEEAIPRFLEERGLKAEHFLGRQAIEDELVYQNSFRLNQELYAGPRGNLAYVQCHGKDLLVLKMVGYAEDVIRYYGLEAMTAHVWIGHHRYPTKGKVWHPGGAHPFVGLNEALVHNGDFANYRSMADYLAERGIRPLFSTDTEVAALVYDLHRRTYGYPLEYVIESLAPTTERDFTLLPESRREIYRAIQTTHIHGSPDGPWFFILAENERGLWRLVGITDTSMLRPQLFALQRGPAAIALCGSEKQVIDAALASLAREDSRFWGRADRYWAARGGSHTDGGAFVFDLRPRPEGGRELVVSDKFGQVVDLDAEAGELGHDGRDAGSESLPSWPPEATGERVLAELHARLEGLGTPIYLEPGWRAPQAFRRLRAAFAHGWSWAEALAVLDDLVGRCAREESRGEHRGERREVLRLLTLLSDRRFPLGGLRRSRWLSQIDLSLRRFAAAVEEEPCEAYRLHASPGARPRPEQAGQTLLLDARRYAVEGSGSAALELAELYRQGWRRFLVLDCQGHRFLGSGLGDTAEEVVIDVYGCAGDYLASGGDGLELRMHGDAQDQLAQIFKRGTLVVHGDLGQAFGYGAKGGEVYVLGNAAGRPLINAVGNPRVVINGTCLDYLGESFMAGDPLDGGGFVVLNGVRVDARGRLRELATPYPGGNLFSLASGGALYVRDPHRRLDEGQLNGTEFGEMSEEDWQLIEPYLRRNEELFRISVADLLTVGAARRRPAEVYRKVAPVQHQALQAEAAWVGHKG